jgi:3-dehydroquinate dehydratase-1
VVAKVSTKVQSTEDVINLFSLYSQPGRKVILGMGPQGRITRVAAPFLGSEFTFASPFEGVETAPGQMSAGQLKAIYNLLNGS